VTGGSRVITGRVDLSTVVFADDVLVSPLVAVESSVL
jgi:hypothetical protein